MCLPVPHTRNGKAPAAANGSVHDCEGTARPAMSLQPPEHLLEPLTVTDPRRAPPLPALATSNPLSVSKDLPNLGIFHINGIIQRVTLRVWLRHLASHSRCIPVVVWVMPSSFSGLNTTPLCGWATWQVPAPSVLLGLFLPFGHCGQGCHGHSCVSVCLSPVFTSFGSVP